MTLKATIIDVLPDTVGHDIKFWNDRGCVLDCRGSLTIHSTSNWGFFVKVFTRSHDISTGICGKWVDRPVMVGPHAWVGSQSFLYNCVIGEGVIVAAGSVVCSCEVAPYVIVAGNPAKVVARWNGSSWDWVLPRWRTLE